MTHTSGDPYAHLRANATAQKQATVDRLSRAITQLENEGREVSTFTIKEVSGMDYMAYDKLMLVADVCKGICFGVFVVPFSIFVYNNPFWLYPSLKNHVVNM